MLGGMRRREGELRKEWKRRGGGGVSRGKGERGWGNVCEGGGGEGGRLRKVK